MISYWNNQLNNLTSIHDFIPFIRDFFSKNGEADKIIVMYNRLHNEANAYKEINVVDLNISRSFFNEYEIGFLKHLAYHSGDEAIIGITDIANDKFINEIFDGSYNKPVKTKLCDAAGNLEVLIELINDIEIMNNNLNRLSDSYSHISYEKFVIKYLKRIISEVISTYNDINATLDGTNNTKIQYKLFM